MKEKDYLMCLNSIRLLLGNQNPVIVAWKAINRIRPLIRFSYRVSSGKKYKIPSALASSGRDYFQAIDWITRAANEKKNFRVSFGNRVGAEVSLVARDIGSAVKNFEVFHKLAATSQSFLKFNFRKSVRKFYIKRKKNQRKVNFSRSKSKRRKF